MEYWTDEGLSVVVSGVGSPLYTDHRTMDRTRIDFARVCVEVDASTELMREVEIQDSEGLVFSVLVDYDWEPDFCSMCKCFEHSYSTCMRDMQAPLPSG